MAQRKRKKMSWGALIWWVLGALLAVTAAGCVLYHVFGGSSAGQSDCPDAIAGIPVHTDYIAADSAARPGTVRDIHYIVIHETDNDGAHATARAHNEYIHENCWKEKKSWHYTVDDAEIWHHLPDRETAYHAGDNIRKEGGNRNGIGIELCVNAGGDFDQTMRNAAQLTAYLLLHYDLTLDAVKKHQDFSGKLCPQTILTQNKWNDFLDLVQHAYDEQSADWAQGSA